MNRGKKCYLEYYGRPACESQYQASKVWGFRCSYATKREAQDAIREIRRRAWVPNGKLRIVAGPCPSYEKVVRELEGDGARRVS